MRQARLGDITVSIPVRDESTAAALPAANGPTTSRDLAARDLAARHFRVEPGLTHVFRLNAAPDAEGRPGEPIKLLEVNAGTVPSGVLPLHFGPAPASGILYPSVIVEVTPAEFDRIQARELALPRDWTIGEEITRPADADED